MLGPGIVGAGVPFALAYAVLVRQRGPRSHLAVVAAVLAAVELLAVVLLLVISSMDG